jgi:ankyrin repeat protein
MIRKFIAVGAFLILHLLVVGQPNADFVSAVEAGNLALVQQYLQQSESANWCRSDYVSALSIALQTKNRHMAQLLIDHGANLYSWTGAGSPLKFCGDPEICEWFRGIRNAAERMAKAASDGDIPTLQAIVAQGFSLELADSLNGRPLYIAAKKGNLEMVRALLKLGAKASLAWEENKAFSPLHAAAQEDHFEVAKLLIENGADLNARFANGAMPLHLALHANHPEVAVLLIESGANLEAPLHTAGYPIILAAQFRNKKILDLLIEKGATKPRDISDQEYFLKALANFGDVELYKFYANKLGIDLLLPTWERTLHEANPLVSAAAHDSLPLVKYMVEELHYDVNRISWGESPLTMACRLGHLEIVRYLLDKGADINAPVDASNALGRAVINCRTNVVELLLQRGAKIGTVNNINHPLSLACTFNCLEGAKILVKYGAIPEEGDCAPLQGNETQQYIRSAQKRADGVFRAMKNKDYATVEAYLKASGNPNAVYERKTLLETAVSTGDLTGITLLFRYKADANFSSQGSVSPLALAATSPNCRATIKTLVANGAAINPKLPQSWTPLAWAAKHDRPEAVQTLLEMGADPNRIDSDLRPDWFSAVNLQNPKCLQMMLASAADLKLEDFFGRNALYYATHSDTILQVLMALPGIVVQDTDKFGLNILAYLRPNISIKVIELILKHPINVNAANAQIRISVANNAAQWYQMPEKVDLLRKHGFDVEAAIPNQSPFYLAAYTEESAEFRRLIDQFHPPFDPNHPVYGPQLWQACLKKDDIGGLKFLIKHGLDINSRDQYGRSLLQFAYNKDSQQQHNDSLIQTILNHHPNLEIADSLGHTILMQTMQLADTRWAQYLVIHGADPNRADRSGYTALLHLGYLWEWQDVLLPSLGSSLLLVKWMIRNGANPHKKALDGRNLLMAACYRNDFQLAQYLIDTLNFSVNDTAATGESAFTMAVSAPIISPYWTPEFPDFEREDPSVWFESRIPLVRYLISKGANVNAMNRYTGSEPIGLIYQYGYTDFAKECVEAGYKINRVTTARNLFQSAVMQKDYNFVKYLLRKGLDPNLHFNGMPLERAVADPKMLEILQGR